jgi:IMP dehydrogenase
MTNLLWCFWALKENDWLIGYKYSFDDLLILPGPSIVEPTEASVKTFFARNIELETPIVSSPMDTVTEATLAIEMARAGGIGVIHRNMSLEKEVEEVRKVKSVAGDGNSTVDEEGRLRVAAAVGPYDIERAKALEKAGADAIVIDTAHGHNLNVIASAKRMRKEINIDLIVGNIATSDAVEDYLVVEPDAFRVGIGPGSICTTRIVTGVGVPQASAIHDVYEKAREYGIPVIGDGGIRTSGDIVKALALGADTVMLGNLLARALESPGKVVDGSKLGLKGKYKLYRGMGSSTAIGSTDRYMGSKKHTPEGVEGLVPVSGTVREIVSSLVNGLKQGMGYIGASNIKELRIKARFILVTEKSLGENRPHDIIVIDPEKWVELQSEEDRDIRL